MSQEAYDLEAADGIRMPWNVWPRSKVEALKCVLPFSAFYSPAKPTNNLQVLGYPPVTCKGKGCGAALNPFADIHYDTKMWVCPFCATRNYFPSYYSEISPEQMPTELFEGCTTVEYVTAPPNNNTPPVYVFVVDTSISEDELEACKTTLSQALQMMPEESLVGLVSFGTHVHVHELQESSMSRVYVFRGSMEYTYTSVATQLGLHGLSRQKAQNGSLLTATKFLVSLDEAEFQIQAALESLQVDAHQPVSDHRMARCTGTALQVAASLVDVVVSGQACPARLMLFVGGPCTEGKAAMVPKEKAKEIRSHKDLAADNAPLWKPALKFYTELSSQLIRAHLALDVFACALEQSGLAEMKPAIQATGGLVVQTDTFWNPVFKDSLSRVFAKEGDPGFSGRSSCGMLDVYCSRGLKVSGMLGCGASTQKDGPHVSNQIIGEGKTTQWTLAALDNATTLCVLFEITADGKNSDKMSPGGEAFYLQFNTKYLHYDGSTRHRVTTVSRRWAAEASVHDLGHGFDQEAAAALLGRYMTWKMETEEDFNATRWIDRSLIRLCQRFAQYNKDEPDSFRLMPEMTLFPGFVFHMRRSQFVQVFGNSPDETAYARLLLFKETAPSSILMLQPQLLSYSVGAEGTVEVQPTLVDVSSIVPGAILFMDAYFYIVVFHGSDIARWRQEGYHEQPGYESFAELLAKPKQDAAAVVASRFPVPRVVDADNFTVQGRSQSRFLLVRLNPSSTHSSAAAASEVIFTDDVSLEVFLQHLKTLAVQS